MAIVKKFLIPIMCFVMVNPTHACNKKSHFEAMQCEIDMTKERIKFLEQ